jgi:hypothetical protein
MHTTLIYFTIQRVKILKTIIQAEAAKQCEKTPPTMTTIKDIAGSSANSIDSASCAMLQQSTPSSCAYPSPG